MSVCMLDTACTRLSGSIGAKLQAQWDDLSEPKDRLDQEWSKLMG